MKKLEEARIAGTIGSSLQAEVTLEAGAPDLPLLESLGDDLRYVLITSKATLRAAGDSDTPAIEVVASPHAKCERCWHYRPDVGADTHHPGICGRCAANLEGPGEVRRHA